jgi:hypothetical protein
LFPLSPGDGVAQVTLSAQEKRLDSIISLLDNSAGKTSDTAGVKKGRWKPFSKTNSNYPRVKQELRIMAGDKVLRHLAMANMLEGCIVVLFQVKTNRHSV